MKGIVTGAPNDIPYYQTKMQWSLQLKLDSVRYSKGRHHQHHKWNMQRSWLWRTLDFLTRASVLSADHHLYAIIKLFRWQYPDTLGEDKLVAMMVGFHIEVKMHVLRGKQLHGSGWVTILFQVEVLTFGCAQSTLNEYHLKRTRHVHQVSLLSLCVLKQSAYLRYWENIMGPQKCHLSTTMDIEFLMTSLSIPCGKGTSKAICASIWRTRGLVSCPGPHQLCTVAAGTYTWHVPADRKHPNVHDEFIKSNFVVLKSLTRPCLSCWLNRNAHELLRSSMAWMNYNNLFTRPIRMYGH